MFPVDRGSSSSFCLETPALVLLIIFSSFKSLLADSYVVQHSHNLPLHGINMWVFFFINVLNYCLVLVPNYYLGLKELWFVLSNWPFCTTYLFPRVCPFDHNRKVIWATPLVSKANLSINGLVYYMSIKMFSVYPDMYSICIVSH